MDKLPKEILQLILKPLVRGSIRGLCRWAVKNTAPEYPYRFSLDAFVTLRNLEASEDDFDSFIAANLPEDVHDDFPEIMRALAVLKQFDKRIRLRLYAYNREVEIWCDTQSMEEEKADKTSPLEEDTNCAKSPALIGSDYPLRRLSWVSDDIRDVKEGTFTIVSGGYFKPYWNESFGRIYK
ncbi:uncharacterized protein KY384_000774 [Bacidia gigantensis]|uniref:uncharacterized protein n=1 Tax=Bacidia gigantensis TaxID=2732470 RepID=UPI001D0591FF|nr:uncharacterized protein KY384_000774 [Bacidia gigantensis]KAG8526012.1 hypothetical protein KY384_000774 [Bacidia gigantensis]